MRKVPVKKKSKNYQKKTNKSFLIASSSVLTSDSFIVEITRGITYLKSQFNCLITFICREMNSGVEIQSSLKVFLDIYAHFKNTFPS